jgi:hypothetical protein
VTNLYRVHGEQLASIEKQSLQREEQLENWIEEDPSLAGLNDVLIIGRQVTTSHNGRIDLLAIDREGNLTIIELKRDRTPRDVVGQVLDYASWASGLGAEEINAIAQEKLGKSLGAAFFERFDAPLPEVLNTSHRMLIVASELDPSSKRIVEYLAQQYDVGINTVFFSVFGDGQNVFLATDWLMDQQEVTERSQNRKKLPWAGLWYVNVGEGPHRSWDDMRKYGFIAAGGGRAYSGKLEQLSVDDKIYAYQKKAGYVGYGRVTQTARMAKDFEVAGSPVLKLPLAQPNLGHALNDPEKAEYLVGVEWIRTVQLSEAKTFVGAFANPNVVCKLREPRTIEFLKREFGD